MSARRQFEEKVAIQAGRRLKEQLRDRSKATRILNASVGAPFSKSSFIQGAMWVYDTMLADQKTDNE